MEEFSNTFAGLFMPVFMGEFSAGLRPLNEHNERFNLSKDMVNQIYVGLPWIRATLFNPISFFSWEE